MGLSPPSAKKNLGPIPTSIFEWDLFHLEAVGPIPWDLVDFTKTRFRPRKKIPFMYEPSLTHLSAYAESAQPGPKASRPLPLRWADEAGPLLARDGEELATRKGAG